MHQNLMTKGAKATVLYDLEKVMKLCDEAQSEEDYKAAEAALSQAFSKHCETIESNLS